MYPNRGSTVAESGDSSASRISSTSINRVSDICACLLYCIVILILVFGGIYFVLHPPSPQLLYEISNSYNSSNAKEADEEN